MEQEFDDLATSINCIRDMFRKCFSDFYQDYPEGYSSCFAEWLSSCEEERRRFCDRYPKFINTIGDKLRHWCISEFLYHDMLSLLLDKARSIVLVNVIVHVLRVRYGPKYRHVH